MDVPQLMGAFNEALIDTDRDRALRLLDEATHHGVTPEEAVFAVIIPALEQLGAAFGAGHELNLAQHFLTSQIAAAATEEMVARFQQPPETAGRVVIGCAQGDLHTLGKRIVIGCLRAQMIECVDLGVNVAPERFVSEAVACQAPVIAISAMMVHTALGEDGCLRVRHILRARRLEHRIKVLVGGAPFRFSPELCQRVQADAWAEDGLKAGPVIAELIQGVRP